MRTVGVEIALADFALLVDEIDFQHGFLALADFYVADIDVLDDAAAAVVGLDADHTVEFRAVHLAVLHEEIAEAA